MLNNNQASEAVTEVATALANAAPLHVRAAKAEVPSPLNDAEIEDVQRSANEAAKFAGNEAKHRGLAVSAHANAAWLYMNAVTAETDAEKHKAAGKLFGEVFKAAYSKAGKVSDDASKKALSRVKSTATRAYNADCTSPEDVAALGTQTAADKAASANRNAKTAGAPSAGKGHTGSAGNTSGHIGDHEATYATIKAFLEIFEAGEFKPKVGGDVQRIKGLVGVLKAKTRAYYAASAV